MSLPILCILENTPNISVDMSLPREAVLPLEAGSTGAGPRQQTGD